MVFFLSIFYFKILNSQVTNQVLLPEKLFLYKQGMGNMEGLLYPGGPYRVLLGFIPMLSLKLPL